MRARTLGRLGRGIPPNLIKVNPKQQQHKLLLLPNRAKSSNPTKSELRDEPQTLAQHICSLMQNCSSLSQNQRTEGAEGVHKKSEMKRDNDHRKTMQITELLTYPLHAP